MDSNQNDGNNVKDKNVKGELRMNNERRELSNEDFHIANLTSEEKNKIEHLEEELGVTLVAYDCNK